MITLPPIGFVRCSRTDLSDDRWDHVSTHIELADDMDPDALAGLEEFSHAEILFHFDRIAEASVERRSRHPRGNSDWPRVGILAQRGSARVRQPAWATELMARYWG